MKTLIELLSNPHRHWVGDGFPVRSLFSYQGDTRAISPFLLFDYAGPWDFEPAGAHRRGVGPHPHRGFETVTIVYEGGVSHRDSAGHGGTIGPGDVQWMTAGSGIVHEEYHAPDFAKTGGAFRVVQLWVNLPAKDKGAPAAYQAITRDMIPEIPLAAGRARLIAGAFGDARGPAKTFTPINLWDVRLLADAEVTLPVPDGHNSLLAVLSGQLSIDGQAVGEAEIARLTEAGAGVTVKAHGDTMLLVMTGVPIDEPVVGQGPFVMNTHAQIRQAIADFNSGRFTAIGQSS